MGYLISIDGLDGCGKTTLGKKLAERINGTYYYTPPTRIHSIREIADNSTSLIRYYYYMLGNLIASRDFEKLLKSGHVISDRYFYATRAYHEPLGIIFPISEELLIPDAIVYITASQEVMKKRLKGRTNQTPYENEDYLRDVADQYELILRDLPNVVRVDSTNRDPDDVADEIISKLGFLKL